MSVSWLLIIDYELWFYRLLSRDCWALDINMPKVQRLARMLQDITPVVRVTWIDLWRGWTDAADLLEDEDWVVSMYSQSAPLRNSPLIFSIHTYPFLDFSPLSTISWYFLRLLNASRFSRWLRSLLGTPWTSLRRFSSSGCARVQILPVTFPLLVHYSPHIARHVVCQHAGAPLALAPPQEAWHVDHVQPFHLF